MATRPFESRIQDLVYNIEVGIGLQVVKTFLYVLFMVSLAVLYMATEYAGFNSPKAMEYAQLGRAYAESGELNTRHVRPASMWFLIQNKKFEEPLADGKFRPRIENHPDILHAPLYPMVLGTAFKTFKTQFPRPEREKFAPEQWVIVPINLVLSFLSALLLYLMGRTLFDPRVALTGCTIFFLSGSVWAHAVSGTENSLLLFLCTFVLWCGAKVIQVRENAMAAAWKSIVPALLGTLACVALFLTRYAAVAVVPGFLLILWMGARRRGWLFALAGLLIFLAGISPWLIRNLRVSGTVFGLAPYTALQDENDTFMRSLVPDLDNLDIPKQIQARMIHVLPKALGLNGVDFGNGLMIGLFATTFFYRFQRRVPHLLRWGLFLSYLILSLTAGVFGEELLGLAHMFWPAIVLFGVAFFYILLDRMQIGVRVVSLSITALFVLLQALPMLFTIMPPRPGNNYPPYNPAHISFVTAPFKDSELITTDMPWATAWYGGRLSLTLPVSLDEFYEVNDYIKRISCIYLTPLTRDKRYQTDLVRGPYRTWLPITEFRLPRDFPLSFGFPLMSGDQICLADFNRWQPGQ